jgi:signal transduction histidine kinase
VVVTALVVGATSWVVVDRALSPVRRLTRQAETNMASRSLDPVTADGTNDDIDNLANTFNAMLDRLRNADAERRRFVSDASHELRTPLMVLSADAEYVLDHPDASAKPEAEELATAVLDQSTRLTELVDGLLTLATLDEEQPMTAGPISVATLLTSADANSLLAGPPPATEVLVPDVSRSLINVLANALRHHQNQIELEVSVDQERQAVSFIVDDDGPGVPEAERENIFQRFYRPDHGRTRSEGGAGLGLAIARAEIAQAGGTVAVSDSPMGGARFVITVPISSEDRTAR